MSNKLRGYVPFEIGDEEYLLRLGFTQLAAADSQLGTASIQAAMAGRFDAVLALLMAGLSNKRNPANITKMLRNALDDGELNLSYCTSKIAEALEASGVISADDDGEDTEGETEAP